MYNNFKFSSNWAIFNHTKTRLGTPVDYRQTRHLPAIYKCKIITNMLLTISAITVYFKACSPDEL